MTARALLLTGLVALLFAFAEAHPGRAQREAVDSFDNPGAYSLGFVVGGRERSLHVFVPPDYDRNGEPVPLVLVLHGAGGTGPSIASFSGFDSLAREAGFIVAYPDGFNRAWNDARPLRETLVIDDVTFISRMIDFLTTQINIDPERIYVAGYSMGGMMAFRLACQLPHQIAAAASVASTFPAYQLDACLFAEPAPVLIIQGTEDTVIPAEGYRDPYGNRMMLSVGESMRYWAEHNRCNEKFTLETLPDADPEDGTRIRRQAYTDCADGTSVELLLVRGGGHTWPGHPFEARLDVGRTSMDIDATRAIWEFFQRHTRSAGQ